MYYGNQSSSIYDYTSKKRITSYTTHGPKGLPKANLTENARQVLMKRYVRRGDDGKAAENVEEMFWRVAYHVAKVEELWEVDVLKRAEEYYHLLSSKKFFPNRVNIVVRGR